MNLLVTGASGQLGTAIRRIFVNESIIATDRAELDITDHEAVLRFVERERPEAIINCAAYNTVENASEEIDAAFRGNAYGPFFLAEAAKAVGATLVHVSTDYVFDGVKGEYMEDDAPNPLNVYGISKLAGEMLVHATWEKSYIVRTSWLFGSSDAGTRNFVTTMLEKGKDGEIRVVADQHGVPTYAPDLAETIKKIIFGSLPFGVYHVANDGVCSREEFAKEIFRQAGISVAVSSITIAESGSRVRRPASSILRSKKISRLRDWKEALGEYLKIVIS